ncbi:PR5-like receptor kinase [Brassica napus]|uniref:PR5-like receptor kinase n=1 Tax=Brassica napus TaxID=3708 RepID=UPI0006AB2120|nr:PR5-like receptor kinase [Brassica napus]
MFFIFNLMALRIALLLFLASHLSVSVTSRSFTIENKCDFTIWPATYNYQGSVDTTGFILEKGEKRTINTTSSWKGYLWGRTLCSRDSSAGYFSCITGDCDSGNIECSKEAVPPATLAEFNLVSDGGNDYYDVSVINGYNLPVLVTPENGLCKSIGCDIDIKKTCPTELWMPDIKSNDPYACRTSCQKNQTRELCCVGHYQEVGIPPQECKRTIYSETFNRTCPGAYSYAYDSNSSTFTCPYSSNFVIQFCPGPNRTTIPKTGAGEKGKSLLKLILIIGGSSVFAMIIIIAIVIKAKANDRRKSDWDGKNIEAVVMLKRFSYVQVKKMTKSFADVLGRGGFGTVYKGKLPDSSRDVAVKILKESNENGEDFINEVASMSRTSHVNIVSLLGFCYEGSKKAIIYEFMPNGSLDKFISDKMSEKMEWKTLYNIAVGVSRGLEYLHNRCVTRIVHFDIKPQNILMDGESCPKISDFGLAKLCKNNESIMSMLDTRGTAGYIAPEVFSKNFGGVSHKSDVYSYGMVVLEMIGARDKEKAQKSGSNNKSMYFPDWIYKGVEKGEIMSFFEEQITEEDDEILVRKMVLVGLWCIQTNPFDRPSMSKVVEMLEGSPEALRIPPKPLLSIPAITVQGSAGEVQDTSSQDISLYSEEAVQEITEEHSLRSS